MSITLDSRCYDMEKVQQMTNDKGIMKIEILGDGNSVAEVGSRGLSRQTSMTKTNCLCSPTTHPGSFRCRIHRSLSLQRTKSMEAASLLDSPPKPADSPSAAL
ncbi:hypothetical protein ARALYDRAFT_894552 [Arabidopsis lyrata subsp. lyrata]|uniref:Uncharacterized protein n=1 Tax=Arabidopsis lyrata subsp. lyrata TaxID=81972 RepID=D7KVR0_ARALL|nr:hypothetical protein ARALYDRAFT_894552 [Arabidopsis lyrata subsp. lyrata]